MAANLPLNSGVSPETNVTASVEAAAPVQTEAMPTGTSVVHGDEVQGGNYTDTAEMLMAFRDNRAATYIQLRHDLQLYNQNLHQDVAEFLKEASTARVASRELLAVKLKQETIQRKAEVQAYLLELRQERARRQARLALLAASPMLTDAEIKAALGWEAAASYAPARPAGGSRGEVKPEQSRPELKPIEADELALFLMTLAGVVTQDKLEKHFGRERLAAYWDDFVSLFEEFQPGSRSALEGLREG